MFMGPAPTDGSTFFDYPGSRLETPLLPAQPHAKQRAFLESPARHRWAIWANQSGKTCIGAIEGCLLALGRHPYHQHWQPPIHGWASALSWELWENLLLPELLTWLPPDRVLDAPEPYTHSTKRTIRVLADNGRVSTITGKSADQGAEKYQSARRHWIWLDEEHPESVWSEMVPRLVRFGGITWGTMTPLKGLTWVHSKQYVPWQRGLLPETWCSHAGMADNPGIGPDEIEAARRQFEGSPAMLEARLYGHFTQPVGMALREYDPNRNLETWTPVAIRQAVQEQGWPLVCGIDFGHWRFAFLLAAADRAGRLHVVEEVYSQRQTLEQRARRVDDLLRSYGASGHTRIWGDAANPTDITEINEAFKRLGSPFRVVAVLNENKLRAPSVERLNNLLARGALLIRRDMAERSTWMLGQSAARDGTPVAGSRLLWEIANWRYPEPREVKGVVEAQKQDPDDDTADGADCIAALRYLVMSWWSGAKWELPPPEVGESRDLGLERALVRHAKRRAVEDRQTRAVMRRLTRERDARDRARNRDLKALDALLDRAERERRRRGK